MGQALQSGVERLGLHYNVVENGRNGKQDFGDANDYSSYFSIIASIPIIYA